MERLNDTRVDMLPDGWEVRYGLSPCVRTTPDSPNWDADNDGLGLSDEFRCFTSPANADSDGDGVSDGVEVAQGSSPNDAADGGDPANCVRLKLTVGDPSGSHSERWNLEVAEEDTGKVVVLHCDAGFGTPGSTNYALVKGMGSNSGMFPPACLPIRSRRTTSSPFWLNPSCFHWRISLRSLLLTRVYVTLVPYLFSPRRNAYHHRVTFLKPRRGVG
ncbi:MAG: hypothetical protein GX174_03315 [Lentisphaerae bacterium]|jgi:hypothetical protein|nr:hypothetical protein [Lentisphaerota bacterium]